MQTRVIELVDNRDQTLSIFCATTCSSSPAYGRELAYNDFRDHEQNGDPFAHRVGTAEDRNVELLLTAPFGVIGSGPPQRLRDQLPAPALSGRP
jgi:hypothetical protein